MNKSLLLVNKLISYHKPIRLLGLTTTLQHEVKSNFVPVYKLPLIKVFAAINRLKLYQTAFTVISIPVCIGLNMNHVVSAEMVWYAGALGLSSCLTLYGFGVLTNRLIGIIYYNEKDNLSKVSYIDFWGNRKDKIIPIEDIIPLSDLPTSPTDILFKTFRQISTGDTLKLNVKYGEIINEAGFKRVL